jgi:hypothetical protein
MLQRKGRVVNIGTMFKTTLFSLNLQMGPLSYSVILTTLEKFTNTLAYWAHLMRLSGSQFNRSGN